VALRETLEALAQPQRYQLLQLVAQAALAAQAAEL
jgi:hypothetical protein